MAKKKVLIWAGPKGEIEVEAVGFKDDSCFKETADFEAAIGAIVKVDKKPEAQRKAKRNLRSVKKSRGLPSGFCG